MSREKQIEEMARFVCNACEMGSGFDGSCADGNDYRKCGISTETAKKIYNAGYRKASEVAREIFEEIENVINYALCIDITEWEAFAELKKKYTEGGE